MTELSQEGEFVTLSRNETESLCMKAARGAGFSWGMAEEAGFAAGWLAARGIDGATALLEILCRNRGRTLGLGAPRPAPGHWQAQDDSPLCPIQLGAALIDHALISDGPFSRQTRIDPVEAPLLLLPFLVRVAEVSRKSLSIGWGTGRLDIAPDGAFVGRAADGWIGRPVLAMTITPLARPGAGLLPTEPGQLPSIPVSTMDLLGALALRTTVPATQASRTGAGASTPDDD